MSEFCIINRLRKSDRIEIVGRQHLEEARSSGKKLIFISMHLSTWELLAGHLDRVVGTPISLPYQPEPNRFSNELLYRERRARGQYCFPPARKSAFRLHRILQSGAGSLLFFIDEVDKRQIRLPLFGRALPKTGNAVKAIKMANTNGALLVPVHLRRTAGCHFQIVFHSAVVPSGTDERCDLKDALQQMNEHFEQLVLKDLEHWYMLSELRL